VHNVLKVDIIVAKKQRGPALEGDFNRVERVLVLDDMFPRVVECGLDCPKNVIVPGGYQSSRNGSEKK